MARAVCVFIVLVVLLLSASMAQAAGGSQRTRYQVYFESGLCPIDIAEQVDCSPALPICCVANNSVRCCERNMPCERCTQDVLGYQMARGSVLIGVMSLVMVLLIGTMVASGLGRHLAWSLERSRLIGAYREKMQLRRTAAKRFKEELAATEERDLADEVACTICCARRMDCALAPCGHVCCCHFCAKRLKECPVCRMTVEQCYDLPAYLVSRLVGQAREEEEAAESGGRGAGHRDVYADQEMREMRGSDLRRSLVEDERETMPGLLSTAAGERYSEDDADEDDESPKKIDGAGVPHKSTERTKKNKYQRANCDDERTVIKSGQSPETQTAPSESPAAKVSADVAVDSTVNADGEPKSGSRPHPRPARH